MRRFWFTFQIGPKDKYPCGVNYGCGVTAYDREDAENILKEAIFVDMEMLPIERCVEDVDISTLDEGHVIPNMGNIFSRGLWFPLG